MSANVDRNLLFGILAVQLDFLSRDDLIAGMNAWLLEKSKPLEDVLVEQEWLDSDKRDLLEPLVKAHIELHQGNAAQSLSAISLSLSIVRKLQSLNDPDVQASIGHLGNAADIPSDEDPYATVSSSSPDSPSSRFRILRRHGRGGLGEVFVAKDEELNRDVALKQIRSDRHVGVDDRGRFMLEAEITGA
ncbi:MAG: hypothetical protein KDA84_05630 [Planctomycetaceae bacterium]|nr:hypothetical protein [Planctomycetaceae bacterium]